MTPHLGKFVERVQYTIFGLIKIFAPEGMASSPLQRETAFRTDSKGFSYRTIEMVCFKMCTGCEGTRW